MSPNKDKYHNLTTEQKKTRNQNSNEKRKLRLEKLKKGKKEPDSCSARSKRWRASKAFDTVVDALITMHNSRALRLNFDSPNYNEEVRISEFDTPDMGKGVKALTHIPPATKLCAYEGQLISSYRTVLKRLREGNDKLLQLGDKQLWLDGRLSRSLGPKFNHACDCVANSEIVVLQGKAYMYTKSSAPGNVKPGDQMTVDYGYGKLTKSILKDKHLQWYVQYQSTHKCKRLGHNDS